MQKLKTQCSAIEILKIQCVYEGFSVLSAEVGKYIDRGDITALTQEAASISEIPYVMDLDREEVDKILNSD